MLFALGAVSSAIDAFQSLTSSSKSFPAKAGFSQAAASFDVTSTATALSETTSGSAGGMPGNGISPATMNALLAAQGQASGTTTASISPSDALQDLFSQIDGNGDGAISKSEFEGALGAGGTNLAQADDVFGKLDSNGDGSVSLDEMSSALNGAGGHRHRHAHGAGGSQSGTDALLQALDAASSTSTTNSDGSISTTITMADGTKVTQISLPASAMVDASSLYNFVGQAMQREGGAVSASAAQSLSVSV